MTSPAQLTLDEFLKLPESEPSLEFEDGMVIEKVSPKGQHSVLQVRLVERINRVGEPNRLAMAFTELRVTFGGRSPVPDISVYRWERIPTNDEGEIANDFFEPPDIVVEIVSPEQSINRLIRRCLWYVAHGVRLALLVDPADKSVFAFEFMQAPRDLRGSDRIDFGEILPGFELVVQELFDSIRLR